MSFRQFRCDLRETYRIHRPPGNRVLWAMVHFYFGRWVLRMHKSPLRWIFNALYAAGKNPIAIVTGISLDRTTQVGRCLHIVHPGMVYIHPQAVIGDRVGLMHSVTIGINRGPGVPRIGDDVFIGAGAVVVGDITIGNGAKIAANSLVVVDVPPRHTAIGVPAKVYPPKDLREPASSTLDPPPASSIQ